MARPRKQPFLEVGERVVRHYEWLRRLSRTKSHTRRLRLLREASVDQLLALVEVTANIVRRRFPLSVRQRQRLVPFAQAVRALARSRTEKSARKLVVQNGGGGLLAAVLTPVLIEVARHLLTRSSDG